MLRHAIAALLIAAPAVAQQAPPGGVRPRPDLDAFAEMMVNDYPPAAVADHLEGDVHVALCVSAEGAASDITLKKSSGVPVLDEATVKGMAGLRFTPGRDAQGRAVAWCEPPYEMIVQWRLPAPRRGRPGHPDEALLGRLMALERASLRPDDDGAPSVTFCVDEKGALHDVRLEWSSDNPRIDAATLRVMSQMRFTPALDVEGRPVSGCAANEQERLMLAWSR